MKTSTRGFWLSRVLHWPYENPKFFALGMKAYILKSQEIRKKPLLRKKFIEGDTIALNNIVFEILPWIEHILQMKAAP